jgi:serine/threonine-protein kinase
VEAAEPLVADRLLHGRYRLVRPIARGGMAEVWEGRDEVLARGVAIKVLHRHLASDRAFLDRFRREAVAAARLSHPNVVATFDAATKDDDEAFIVMELVRGRSLRQALTDEGPMEPTRAVTVALQVASALGHAHANGLIHRDVKPGNILLCEEQSNGRASDSWVRAKVADFGIAKAVAESGSDVTQTGAVLGTAKYIAPEVVEGREPDARSDIYALGVTLYEMLCGRPPFAAETELATALAHVRSDPVPPRQLRAGIPRPLEQVVLHALTRDPEGRPQSSAALRTELGAVDLDPDDATSFLSPDPTPAVPVPMNRPAQPPAPPAPTPVAHTGPSTAPQRRHGGAVVLAAVALAVVLVLAIVVAISRRGGSGSPRHSTPPAAATPIHITSAAAFDPLGDGDEHNDEAALAIDGKPATAWETQRYFGPQFGGGLKKGVGLVLRVDGQPDLHQLQVTSTTMGWSAQVYIADVPGTALAEWGQPVAQRQVINGNATFDLHGTSGGAVLLWITDTGQTGGDYRTEIAEARLS